MVSKAFSLYGKIAVVTGDNGFWNTTIATALADAEADIVFAAKDIDSIKQAREQVEHLGQKCIAIPTDTSQPHDVQKMVEQIIKETGKIDILVNASDTEFAKPIDEISEREWNTVIDYNLKSTFFCCQKVGQVMLKQKRGRIINLVSCLAERGMENGTAYCAAMGGILQLTRSLAIEWGKMGITVNAVSIGWFAGQPLTKSPNEGTLLKFIPTRRFGKPEEIGSTVVYLASDATDFYTGQVVYVDGGIMVRP